MGLATQKRVSLGSAPRTSRSTSKRPSLLPDSHPVASSNQALTHEHFAEVIKHASKLLGPSALAGFSYPHEWETHVFINCGRTYDGHRLVLFIPGFLQYVLDDAHELDRVFKFILLRLDEMARKEKFVLVFCNAGPWIHSSVRERIRMAYDILPPKYGQRLQSLYILHPTMSLKLLLWSFWPWFSSRLWSKIKYFDSMDVLCRELFREDSFMFAEARRRFPLLVQREDAARQHVPLPTSIGVRIKQLCDGCSVDLLDAATGRWYPRLPSPLVLVCEALERQAADEAFSHMHHVSPDSLQALEIAIEEGQPLDPELPLPVLWRMLKLFVDSLPTPLLSFQSFQDMVDRRIGRDNARAQRGLLVDLLCHRLPSDLAYSALYLASFFRKMCFNAEHRSKGASEKRSRGSRDPPDEPHGGRCTPELVAQVFAQGFIRPKDASGHPPEAIQAVVGLVKTLIVHADDSDLWTGSVRRQSVSVPRGDSDSESSSNEGLSRGGSP